MTIKEIEMIVDKANVALVYMKAYRIRFEKEKNPKDESEADYKSGIVRTCLDILKFAGVELNNCGLLDNDTSYEIAERLLLDKKLREL